MTEAQNQRDQEIRKITAAAQKIAERVSMRFVLDEKKLSDFRSLSERYDLNEPSSDLNAAIPPDEQIWQT